MCRERAAVDCQVRIWRVKELKRLQSFVDKAYRYVWSRKTKPPTMQMEEEKKNMADVRKDLGIKTIRWKVEKRVYERIGHVMRMEDNRMTKAVTLGWIRELEKHDKRKGRNRKTVSYWKKLVREAGWDATNIGALTADRKNWKGMVKERMNHLLKWEESKGKRWQGGEVVRNPSRKEEDEFKCEKCGKICKSKGGLVNHRRRMHEMSTMKRSFKCDKCELEVKSEASLKNHKKICGGAVASSAGRRKCVCGKEYSESYFRKHRKSCAAWTESQDEASSPETAPPRRWPKTTCVCGALVTKTNLARHKSEACPGGEPGS